VGHDGWHHDANGHDFRAVTVDTTDTTDRTLVLYTVYSDGRRFTSLLSGPDGAATVARTLSRAVHDHSTLTVNGSRLVSYSIRKD
jgi:hypothetical protein